MTDKITDKAISKLLDTAPVSVERNGLLPEYVVSNFREHGVDVKDNAHTSDYLAKSSWGVESEVAMAHRKGGKGGVPTIGCLSVLGF